KNDSGRTRCQIQMKADFKRARLESGRESCAPQEGGCPHQPLCRNLRALAARSRGYRWHAACEERARLTFCHFGVPGRGFKMSMGRSSAAKHLRQQLGERLA